MISISDPLQYLFTYFLNELIIFSMALLLLTHKRKSWFEFKSLWLFFHCFRLLWLFFLFTKITRRGQGKKITTVYLSIVQIFIISFYTQKNRESHSTQVNFIMQKFQRSYLTTLIIYGNKACCFIHWKNVLNNCMHLTTFLGGWKITI